MKGEEKENTNIPGFGTVECFSEIVVAFTMSSHCENQQ
jgi:hypothetical protein